MLDEMNSESSITLVTSDQKEFTTTWGTLRHAFWVRNILLELPFKGGPISIPLPEVDSKMAVKILEYMEHHRNDPVDVSDEDDARKKTADINEWDQKFLQVDQEMLFEIVRAANYLDLKGLLDIGCRTIANMIKGKSPEEIRDTFNVPLYEDEMDEEKKKLTDAEMERIRRENEWAEDR